jgi:hypothetical protein
VIELIRRSETKILIRYYTRITFYDHPILENAGHWQRSNGMKIGRLVPRIGFCNYEDDHRAVVVPYIYGYFKQVTFTKATE